MEGRDGGLWEEACEQSELTFSGERNTKQERSTKYSFNPPTSMDLNVTCLKNLNLADLKHQGNGGELNLSEVKGKKVGGGTLREK